MNSAGQSTTDRDQAEPSVSVLALRRAWRRSSPGTSLVELMMGLMILMVLGGMAIPGIGSLTRNYNLRAAADELVYAVDLARSQAMANRTAYGIVFDSASAGGQYLFRVYKGTDATCASVAVGSLVRTVDYSATNADNNPAIQFTRTAPSEVGTPAAFLCFKPDGRLIRGDNGRTFSAPTGSLLSAGDVVLELARAEGGGAIGTPLQVQIGYNCTARVIFGRPTEQLQGDGQGGGAK